MRETWEAMKTKKEQKASRRKRKRGGRIKRRKRSQSKVIKQQQLKELQQLESFKMEMRVVCLQETIDRVAMQAARVVKKAMSTAL